MLDLSLLGSGAGLGRTRPGNLRHIGVQCTFLSRRGAWMCLQLVEIKCRVTLSTPMTLFHQRREPDSHTPPSLSVLGSKFDALDLQCHERPGVKVGKYC